MQVVVEGEVGSETVKDRQDARSHPRFVRKRQIMRRGKKQRRCLISGEVCDTFSGVPLPTAEVHPAQ